MLPVGSSTRVRTAVVACDAESMFAAVEVDKLLRSSCLSTHPLVPRPAAETSDMTTRQTRDATSPAAIEAGGLLGALAKLWREGHDAEHPPPEYSVLLVDELEEVVWNHDVSTIGVRYIRCGISNMQSVCQKQTLSSHGLTTV